MEYQYCIGAEPLLLLDMRLVERIAYTLKPYSMDDVALLRNKRLQRLKIAAYSKVRYFSYGTVILTKVRVSGTC